MKTRDMMNEELNQLMTAPQEEDDLNQSFNDKDKTIFLEELAEEGKRQERIKIRHEALSFFTPTTQHRKIKENIEEANNCCCVIQ